MSPAARKYLEDNRLEGRCTSLPDITPAIKLRCEIAARVVQGLVAHYGTTENPEILAIYSVNQTDWLLSVLAR